MRGTRTILGAVFLWAGLAAAGHAGAEDAAPAPAVDTRSMDMPAAVRGDLRERRGFGLGIGAAIKDDPYVDIDREVQPFPIFRYVGERFSALGPNLQYRLVGDRPLVLSARLGPTFDGYDPDDSDFLEGMDERKLTVESGLVLAWRGRPLGFSLQAMHDVLDRHGGYSVEAEVNTFRRFGPVAVVPSIAWTYWDEDRSDYYFGVRGREARADRPEYELDGTSNWSAGLFASVDATPRIFLMLGAKYFLYDNDIEDSPILDSGSTWRVFLGAGYQFGQQREAVAGEGGPAGELARELTAPASAAP